MNIMAHTVLDIKVKTFLKTLGDETLLHFG